MFVPPAPPTNPIQHTQPWAVLVLALLLMVPALARVSVGGRATGMQGVRQTGCCGWVGVRPMQFQDP